LRIALQDEIETQLLNFEPRIDILTVAVTNTSEQIDSNELNVTIEFSPINSQQVATLNVVLERAR
jgi:predicted component of type VI protein secretion system